ncbi:MAG: 4Fe-4S binding protein [Phycisphaerae bacterium]|nr:4Fe-4S binding protein [Phycisphaerae bacterium]
MKIAVTSTGPTLDDNVEARFGRCVYFLIVDTDTMEYEAIENPNIALGGGAGIQSAQLMSEKGVMAVLTGNCGPNAFNVFGQTGIQVVVGVRGQVRSAVEQFKAGAFSSASEPNVGSHFGMDTAPADPTLTRQPKTIPFGQGDGRGMGRGISGGRGMDQGMGRGGGMGRCMGGGRGKRMGGGFGMGNWPAVEQPASPSESDVDPAQARAFLQSQLQVLEQQKHQVEQRIRELETGRRLIAIVSLERCAGCGICTDVCPENAIEINGHAVVNSELCTGCGKCVSECPNEAIVIASTRNSW